MNKSHIHSDSEGFVTGEGRLRAGDPDGVCGSGSRWPPKMKTVRKQWTVWRDKYFLEAESSGSHCSSISISQLCAVGLTSTLGMRKPRHREVE